MSLCVFLGPSLPRAEAQALLDAEYLPPVSEGDVYRAALRGPRAIGIIDGYFEVVPAVWHKEILYALSRGIHVFGASSMGALRAAELHAFGMDGIGWIFEAFRDGLLEDDDEVAVMHGPAELGYPNLSEAMVNIRRTLAAAHTAGVIGDRSHEVLVASAKELFYRERSFARVLTLGRNAGLPEPELERLERWLPAGAIDQKRDDARLLLETLGRRFREAETPPKEPLFHFEHTTLWERAARLAGRPPGQR